MDAVGGVVVDAAVGDDEVGVGGLDGGECVVLDSAVGDVGVGVVDVHGGVVGVGVADDGVGVVVDGDDTVVEVFRGSLTLRCTQFAR